MAWVSMPGLPGSYSWTGEVPDILPPLPDFNGGVAGATFGPSLGSGPGGVPSVVGVPSPSTAVPAVAAAIAALGGSVAAVLRWVVATFGAKQVAAALLSLIGVQLFKEVAEEAGQGFLEGGLATLIPGQQGWLGEFPAGMGELGGRVVRTWTAGGARVYFCMVEKPTRRGTRLQPYVYSVKRSAWLPFSYRRNIVVGAKELSLAAALGHKRRMGKRRVLQTIAGTYGGRRHFHRNGGRKH